MNISTMQNILILFSILFVNIIFQNHEKYYSYSADVEKSIKSKLLNNSTEKSVGFVSYFKNKNSKYSEFRKYKIIKTEYRIIFRFKG